MNISHKHNVIWWAPERCGTKITREIFSDYDFFVFDPKQNNEVSLKTRYTSHFNQISEEYSKYKLISNVRNPYDRIFSVFLFFLYSDIIIEKSIHQKIKERFNKWVLSSFQSKKTLVDLSKFNKTDNVNYNFLSKWNLDSRIPDYFIRMENLSEDLQNLDFIKTNSYWSKEKIESTIENNRFITNKPLRFDEIYDFESARRIYFYYKRIFNVVGYNPFSFTKEYLSETEKCSFLHDIL
jgi:hypothetical protein